MHVTELDFATMTEMGALTNQEGNLGRKEFANVIKKQVDGYVRRKMQRSISEASSQENFAMMASLKLVLESVDRLHERDQGKITEVDGIYGTYGHGALVKDFEKDLHELADVLQVYNFMHEPDLCCLCL